MRKIIIPILALCLIWAAGCAAPQPTQTTQLEAEPEPVNVNSLLVRDFQSACDAMARSLIIQPIIQRAPTPPVIAIRPVENKSGLDVDTEIFQETIRVKLVKNAMGKVFFRDDKSRRDIVLERSRQNSEVSVRSIDTIVEEKFSRKQNQSGHVAGFGGAGSTSQPSGSEVSKTKIKYSAKASQRIADVDYFLRGIIFSSVERHQNTNNLDRRYWQFQFRLVDARNGLVVWEDVYRSKVSARE